MDTLQVSLDLATLSLTSPSLRHAGAAIGRQNVGYPDASSAKASKVDLG